MLSDLAGLTGVTTVKSTIYVRRTREYPRLLQLRADPTMPVHYVYRQISQNDGLLSLYGLQNLKSANFMAVREFRCNLSSRKQILRTNYPPEDRSTPQPQHN